jgi:hypothetical protein
MAIIKTKAMNILSIAHPLGVARIKKEIKR